MSIDRVQVRDFQSLKDVSLDLGRLTVIVGASNSGKSAVLRAIKAVATNVNSPSVILRHGKKKAVVRLSVDEDVIQLERGAALSRYALEVPDTEPAVFAKAGTSVPEDLAALMGFASVEGEDLNFALQFDRPFLLDEPSTKVAKVLGDLTGINRIFGAVREANRRRLEVTAKLKVRRADVEALRERAQAYADVPMQRALVKEASEAYWRAVATQARSTALTAQVRVVLAADSAIDALRSLAPLPEVTFNGLDEKVSKMNRLESVLLTWEEACEEQERLQEQVVELAVQSTRAEERYDQMLREAGTCPVCGKPTTQ